jgi:hypothetical protein
MENKVAPTLAYSCIGNLSIVILAGRDKPYQRTSTIAHSLMRACLRAGKGLCF